MGSIPTTQPRPGILVVHPRLHDPTADNAATFLRWTKLHWRDLLNLPAAPDGGECTRALRFSAVEENGKYGHVAGTESKYFYLILASSISVFQTRGYDGMTRRLDVENTRELGEGEEPVGCEKGGMVWDVVSARFSVYAEIDGGGEHGLAMYQDATGNARNCLVAISTPDRGKAEEVCAEVLTLFGKQAPRDLKVFASVYQDAGKDAQPHEHPKIERDAVGGGEWLVLMLVVGERLDVEHVEGMMEGWVQGGMEEVKLGIWGGELDMH